MKLVGYLVDQKAEMMVALMDAQMAVNLVDAMALWTVELKGWKKV